MLIEGQMRYVRLRVYVSDDCSVFFPVRMCNLFHLIFVRTCMYSCERPMSTSTV